MRNIKLTIAYDGTDFHGWQFQQGNPVRTVQGVLTDALARLTNCEPSEPSFRVLGSSRTDAGVHALGQVASVWTDSVIPISAFARALNALLPGDVLVRSAEEVPETFHPIADTQRKRYRYLIHDGALPELFLRRYAWRMGKLTAVRLDAEAMAEGAKHLLGTHNFSALENAGSPRSNSTRTILDISVRRGRPAKTHAPNQNPNADSDSDAIFLPMAGTPNDFIEIEVEADGFLYNMVRNIAGTLMEVGRGHHTSDWVRDVLDSGDRALAGPTAPPQGLYLLWIRFAAPSELPKKSDFEAV